MGSGVAQKKSRSKGRPRRKNRELGEKKYEMKKGPEENKNY
jgi:hypothetical protein